MPEIIIVEIEYDQPEDPYWLNPDNVAVCLHAHCKNTRFKVSWAKDGDPWREEAVTGGDARVIIEKVTEVLRQVEWVRGGAGISESYCPSCHWGKTQGHAEDCKLDALLWDA